jgi:hypothetical protein
MWFVYVCMFVNVDINSVCLLQICTYDYTHTTVPNMHIWTHSHLGSLRWRFLTEHAYNAGWSHHGSQHLPGSQHSRQSYPLLCGDPTVWQDPCVRTEGQSWPISWHTSIYVSICMYVYIYIYIYIYICWDQYAVRQDPCVRTEGQSWPISWHACMHMYVCMYVCVYIYIYMFFCFAFYVCSKQFDEYVYEHM